MKIILIATLTIFNLSVFARVDAVLVKSAGHATILEILDAKGLDAYGANYQSSTTGFGTSSNQLAMHLDDGQSTTLADAILTAVAMPTCTSSLLDITCDVGTYIVSDITSVTADPTFTKFAKAVLTITGATLAIEVLTKTTGAYASPSGTLVADLKEYSVPAAGTVLTEVNDFIH